MHAVLWRPVQPRADPRLWCILAHPERSSGGLDLVADAPACDERAGERWIMLVQRRRDKRAALRLMRKLLKKQGFAPKLLVTDKPRSYG